MAETDPYPAPNFERLKRLIYDAAGQELRKHDPRYVITVRRELASGRPAPVVAEEAAPLLGEHFAGWTKLIATVFDFELAKAKLSIACEAPRTTDASDQERGRRRSHYVDSFIWHHQAVIERFDKLLAQVFRRFTKSSDEGARSAARLARPMVDDNLKRPLQEERNGLSHGMPAIVANTTIYWPMMVACEDMAVPGDIMSKLVAGTLQTTTAEMVSTARSISKLTGDIFASLELVTGVVADYIENLPSAKG